MLIPTKENIQKIFEIHQNQCAFSKCGKKIIDDEGVTGGNILFIESNIEGKPRFNPDLTDEQMIDYHNLILVCYDHAFDVEWKKKYTISKLREEIFKDLEKLTSDKFNFSNEIMEKILFQFIDHHDPDRLSHIIVNSIEYNAGAGQGRGSGGVYADITCMSVYIKPTKQFACKKFEIIDNRTKIREFDKVVFYPKDSEYSDGTQADIEIKSKMRIEGKVPVLPKGKYLVLLRSAIDESSKLEDGDLEFTVL